LSVALNKLILFSYVFNFHFLSQWNGLLSEKYASLNLSILKED